MKLRALGISLTLVLGSVSLGTWAEGERTSECSGDWRVEVSGFSHVVSYGAEDTKVQIEAREACASRFDRPYRLTDVRLTVLIRGRAPVVSYAERATLSVREGSLLLGSAALPAPLPVWVDLQAGVLKSPDGTYLEF